MFIIGLTGSAGTGKSTSARFFSLQGFPVYDADAQVHRHYSQGGDLVDPVSSLFPDVLVDGAIDRGKLSDIVLGDRKALMQLEALVHPFLDREQKVFLKHARGEGAWCAVLDIPLLLETGNGAACDFIAVTHADVETQRKRLALRPRMDEKKLKAILDRQMPSAEKLRKADFIIETGGGLVTTEQAVRKIVEVIRSFKGRDDPCFRKWQRDKNRA